MYDNFFTTTNVKYKKAFPYQVSVAPAALPVSLATVKSYLKISGSAEDDILTMFIEAARDFAEKYTSRVLINTTFTTYRDDFSDDLTLRRSPFSSLTSFEYLSSGSFTAVNASLYGIAESNDYNSIFLTNGSDFPDLETEIPDSIKIVFVAGYGASESDIPAALRLALLAHIAFMYENRGDCAGDCSSNGDSLPATVKAVYNKYKIVTIGSSERSYPSGAINAFGYRL